MPGQAHDLRETRALLQNLSAGHMLADRGFDANWLRTDLLERGITPRTHQPQPAPHNQGRLPQGSDPVPAGRRRCGDHVAQRSYLSPDT